MSVATSQLVLSDPVIAVLAKNAREGWTGEPYTDKKGKTQPGKVQAPFAWAPPPGNVIPIRFAMPESGVGVRIVIPDGSCVYMAGTALRPAAPDRAKASVLID